MMMQEAAARQRATGPAGGEGAPAGETTCQGSETDGPASPNICSICLDEPNAPVKTNCGHWFCAQCMLNHWNHERHPQPCHCPICRREVTLLLCSDDLATSNRQLYSEVSAYNQRMRESQGGIIARLKDIPVLLQHLRQDLLRVRGGLPLCDKFFFVALALALFLYVVSPIDLIPEAIFGIFGLVDDLFAVVYMLLYATGVYRVYVANRQP